MWRCIIASCHTYIISPRAIQWKSTRGATSQVSTPAPSIPASSHDKLVHVLLQGSSRSPSAAKHGGGPDWSLLSRPVGPLEAARFSVLPEHHALPAPQQMWSCCALLHDAEGGNAAHLTRGLRAQPYPTNPKPWLVSAEQSPASRAELLCTLTAKSQQAPCMPPAAGPCDRCSHVRAMLQASALFAGQERQLELLGNFSLASAAGPFSAGAVLTAGNDSTVLVLLNGTVSMPPGSSTLMVTQVGFRAQCVSQISRDLGRMHCEWGWAALRVYAMCRMQCVECYVIQIFQTWESRSTMLMPWSLGPL